MEDDSTEEDLMVSKPRPQIAGVKSTGFKRGSDVGDAIRELLAGKHILIEEFYSNGLDLLNELQSYLREKHPNRGFKEQRAYRKEYQQLSNLILLQINDHRLEVKKGPTIGWLEKLYPESRNFVLTFPQVQGLNSAWQWYVNGVVIPGLRNKIHPYYGVYFPTRFEHLRLFENWLKRYDGPKKTAIDVGIGSGILSLQLMKYGFQKSYGTDLNPNAIIGLRESMRGTKLALKIEIVHSHLFGKWEKPTELIVFNPPWLPASHSLDRLDEAIYYNDQLFPEFFAEAKKRLLPDGKMVILFSNLAQITGVADKHPVKQELSGHTRFALEDCFKKSVKKASDKSRRDQHWRAKEEVELWVLKHGEEELGD